MKTILYIEFMNLGEKGTLGIKKKIFSHIETFQRNNLIVYYAYIENSVLKSNFIKTETAKFDMHHICRSLSKILYESDFSKIDYAYIRFGGFSYEFLKLLQKMHCSSTKIILEIPTYPFIGEYMQSIKRSFLQKNYRGALGHLKQIVLYPFFSHLSKKYIDRIVTFSNDFEIWGIKTIQTCNGISIDRPINHEFLDRPKSELRMICVSSCVNWHGYDRIIEGMKLYYEKDQYVKVYLDIVGEGPETNNYKRMIKKYHLEDYITLCGSLYQNDLDEKYKRANIALDAMGRHRVGVYYNSTLKGKEYALQGLPIVSGVMTEFDKDASFPYYMRVPADDSPVNIEEILKFMKDVEQHKNYHDEIQAYAFKHFNFDSVLKPVIDYINSNGSDSA